VDWLIGIGIVVGIVLVSYVALRVDRYREETRIRRWWQRSERG
jgi:uncharacterized membrane protein